MASDWRCLPSMPLPTPLLLQTEFKPDSYVVRVTDMCSLWSEELNASQIAKRAKELSSPINPEYDRAQMRILLDKIQVGLSQADGSRVEPAPNESLEINMSIPLPDGLAKLNWKFTLNRMPPDATRNILVAPMVGLLFKQREQIEQLAQILTEKDTAVNKILDRIDSIGLDYGTVFPSARLSRKGNQREQVQSHIRGVAPFDKKRWMTECDNIQTDDLSTVELIDKAFGGISSTSVRNLASILESKSRASASPNVKATGPKQSKVVDKTTMRYHSESESQSDEFQRQKTPDRAQRTKIKKSPTPHSPVIPKQSTKMPDAPMADDSTTEDEDDLDAPYRPARSLQENVHDVQSLDLHGNNSPTRSSENTFSGPEKVLAHKPAKPLTEIPVRMTSEPSAMSPKHRTQQTGRESLDKTPTKDIINQSDHSRSELQNPLPISNSKSPDPDALNKTRKVSETPRARIIGKIGRRDVDGNNDSTSSGSNEAQRDRSVAASDDLNTNKHNPVRKLGKIGGPQRTGARSIQSDAETPALETETSKVEHDARIRSVAATNHHPQGTNSSMNHVSTTSGLSTTEPEPELTAQENADRKRALLKKEMEEVKPASKKRRKF